MSQFAHFLCTYRQHLPRFCWNDFALCTCSVCALHTLQIYYARTRATRMRSAAFWHNKESLILLLWAFWVALTFALYVYSFFLLFCKSGVCRSHTFAVIAYIFHWQGIFLPAAFAVHAITHTPSIYFPQNANCPAKELQGIINTCASMFQKACWMLFICTHIAYNGANE